ncbi:MAG: rhodanese-like domain-containing protein [Oligoflexales bacterium]
MEIPKINVKAVHELQENSDTLILLDVREESEFYSESAPNSKNFPLSNLNVEAIAETLGIDKDKTTPLYFICRSGSRSEAAAKKFYFRGYEQVYNVEGGMIKWQEFGLPIRKSDQGSNS